MPEDLPKRPKLLIVSDTAVYVDNEGRYLAFEPVVREIEHFAHLFSSITWVAFSYPLNRTTGNMREIQTVSVKYHLFPAVGGPGIHNRLKIIREYLRLTFLLPKYIDKADVIHSRGPSHPALITVFFSILLFRHKIFWHKYAGNWTRKDDPYSYRVNKFFLKRARRTIVTINGYWSDQYPHILSFENPSLTNQERADGSDAIRIKSYIDKLDFVFIGYMIDSKGAGKVIEAFGKLKKNPRIGLLHMVGDGPERTKYENRAKQLDIECRFYGFLPRQEVNRVLEKAHVILLPSDSEGFPKVIAEGSNYGCIPVVTDISCLSQYIHDNNNGFLMTSPVIGELEKILDKILTSDGSLLASLAQNAYLMGSKFTYDYYDNRIKRDILKQFHQVTDA